MRTSRERCSLDLEPEGIAYICTYECTFCDACAHELGHVCPNCSGELARRPRRR